MTPQDWLTCADPHDLLFAPGPGVRPSPRKLWLFVAGCLRLDWPRLSAPLRALAEAMGRFAEGRATESDLCQAMADAWRTPMPELPDPWPLATGSTRSDWAMAGEFQ